MTNDALNTTIRNLVRSVMTMPAGSVRPSDQMGASGGQGDEIATVKLISADGIGQVLEGQTDLLDGSSTASVDKLEAVVASVQFFRSSLKDAAGIAKQSTAAVERARTLGRRLCLPSSVSAMQALNISLLDVGEARDLAAVADSIWESRGQVDLTFSVSTIETEAVVTVLSAPIDLVFQPPGLAPLPPAHIEVTNP